jgi:TolB protein
MNWFAKVLLAALFAAATLVPATAEAAYPGSKGRIAFVRDGQVWTMRADGTDQVQLTSGTTTADGPQWSPDGTKILYTRYCGSGCKREVRVMNADGSGDAHVFGGPVASIDAYSPAWSPDGSTIAWIRVGFAGRPCICTTYNIDIANPDGSDPHTRYIVTDPQYLDDLEWSPKGDEIAFTSADTFGETFIGVVPLPSGGVRNPVPFSSSSFQSKPSWAPDASRLGYLNDTNPPSETDVWTIRGDATDPREVTFDDVQQYGEEWSPDGTNLVVSGEDPACVAACNADLWTIAPDGSGIQRLTSTASSETDPDWQPVIDTPRPPGYPRPKGANLVRVPLVPAFQPCAVPNSTHGSPLAFPSCNPPAEASPNLTLGTPDANGAAANMVGSVRLKAIPGNPATPENEADVNVSFAVQDVRCGTGASSGLCSNANAEGGADYASQLRLRVPMRLTDRYNLPAPGGDEPGSGDTTVDFLSQCTPTADTSIGSSCSVESSFDAWYPGAVREGRRAIMGLDGIEVLDSGSQGASLFLRQGVFIP